MLLIVLTLISALSFCIWSTLYGQVKPLNASANNLKTALMAQLPEKPLPKPIALINHLSLLDLSILIAPIDIVYVDISGSLNNDPYKTYLRNILEWSIKNSKITKLVAVDVGLRKTWLKPDIQDLDELLEMPFDNNTDFGSYIEYGKSVLVITDQEGLDILRKYVLDKVMIINFKADKTEFIV
jgi:hypothetical protein